ncbi:sulfatase [Paludisphaera sp.]|uniref:sulfatase family protein n=1 Tax=Paludisphaera sp. TaxID=2017432 RepID=UPI00301BE28A
MSTIRTGRILGLLWLLAALIPAAHAGPNILFVVADDWGVHAGAYGTPWVRTPAVDRVAREGLRFDRAYTPLAKCAPSRAVIMTGRLPWRNGEACNHLSYFPAELKAWPEVLVERGWHVGATGKGWGPGVARDADGNPRRMAGTPFNRRKAEPPTSAMSNVDYAANFVDFLDAAPAGSRWCFWYGATEPHRGYEPGSGAAKGGKRLADIDRVPAYFPDEDVVRHDMLDYALEVEHFDAHLGRMLDELESRGLLDDTLVIVTSDHGMPFPRVKGYAYHDSNHIPLLIRWPSAVRSPGRAVDEFVDFTDLAPTILDAAGIDPAEAGMKPVDGRGLRPLLEARPGESVPWRDHVLVGKERTDVGRPNDWGYPIRGMVTADFLYLRNYEPSRWPAGNPETGYLDTDGGPTKTLILQRGRADRADPFWNLCFGMLPADQLYDLRADPDCVRNLADAPEHADRVRATRDRMEAELREQGDPRVLGRGHVFDDYPVTAGAGFHARHARGEKPPANWVEPTDFEPAPVAPGP